MHRNKLIILFFLVLLPYAKPDLSSAQRAALLNLRSAVGGRTLLLWLPTSTTSPCKWPGILCDPTNTHVVALRLPAASLSGHLPSAVFPSFTHLRTLSFRFNSLSGPIPADLSLCSSLRNLYLHHNNLSGELPPSLFNLTSLVRLNLADNAFSGPVRTGFNNLTRLRTLYLENNRFSGSLPELKRLAELAQFNVSNNFLNGSVPETLTGFSKESFLGNTLCGKPLKLCPQNENGRRANGSFPGVAAGIANSGLKEKKKGKLSGGVIAGIVIGCVVGMLLIVFALILLCRKKSDNRTSNIENIATLKQGNGRGIHGEKNHVSEVETVGGGANKKLVFFGNSEGKVFDLEDLLRASAEVLGKGTFGTSYKAVLENGPVVAVKRLKDVTLSESDFRDEIEVAGAMVHQNLVPLRAYYYSRDEKLLVHDYMHMGSLSALLHGNKGAGRTPLTWELRSGIALGAARAVEYLHSQGPNVSHGNIKSSNILLTKNYEARVSDFGLAQLVSPSSTPNRIAGYRAPEVTDPRRVSHKADVYSFGVVLLELLTGKAPTHALLHEEGVDLPRWVQSVVREEWTSEVFDAELLSHQTVEEDMVELLQLAVDCTAPYPDNRPSIAEVRHRIEELHGSKDLKQTQHQHDLISVVDDVS
ncbi:hypothetical protein HN51_070612 [Arachis hypogaea]|uniref:Protein kinase domain-containing protein n=1 Tax=Arachis hypogaea TaxID=3818 RepID=A0A444Z1B0_ARAHY|nr:probable inactive receptor kinase RLK902 [Arachis ipaensis]XP_025655640.1 probable inactive receptor kinase RLK902 [Arachis hypogaea]QHO13049.1 putative inactive receptor kinase [Arachis hypogaea]RYR07956.1 hypothetical protein Ahy_B05g075458 [Arachis hypogaea]